MWAGETQRHGRVIYEAGGQWIMYYYFVLKYKHIGVLFIPRDYPNRVWIIKLNEYMRASALTVSLDNSCYGWSLFCETTTPITKQLHLQLYTRGQQLLHRLYSIQVTWWLISSIFMCAWLIMLTLYKAVASKVVRVVKTLHSRVMSHNHDTLIICYMTRELQRFYSDVICLTTLWLCGARWRRSVVTWYDVYDT